MARTWDLFGWRPEDAPADPFEDAAVTPAAWLLALPVRGYRLAFSPWVGHNCRFQPTCSAYALEALERHGALRGGWLAAPPHPPLPPLGRLGHRQRPARAPPAPALLSATKLRLRPEAVIHVPPS